MSRTTAQAMPITYETLAHYEFAEEGARPGAKPDALQNFKPGLYWTGQIVKYGDGRVLPQTQHVTDPAEARTRAGKGWLPVAFAPDKIKAMWRAYYGADIPKALRAAGVEPEPVEAPRSAAQSQGTRR